jgi:hypothetical protein
VNAPVEIDVFDSDSDIRSRKSTPSVLIPNFDYLLSVRQNSLSSETEREKIQHVGRIYNRKEQKSHDILQYSSNLYGESVTFDDITYIII